MKPRRCYLIGELVPGTVERGLYAPGVAIPNTDVGKCILDRVSIFCDSSDWCGIEITGLVVHCPPLCLDKLELT